MLAPGRTVTRVWRHTNPSHARPLARVDDVRDDLVLERRDGDATFVQADGPFSHYRRTVEHHPDRTVETTEYDLRLPWFRWLFALPVGAVIARRTTSSWWTPPDRLSPRQLHVLGLLAAASMAAAFVNTIFTQTVEFAATEFDASNTAIGDAGSIVRAGIVIALPAAVLADRFGRRRVIVIVAWAAPLLTALGGLAPNFATLVASQTLGRPIGLALMFLVAVVAAEEMPRNTRAYAVSLLAMASGLGAGLAVIALPLADLGVRGWRLVYLVTLVWLVVAVDLARRLPETERFQTPHRVAPPLDRRRFAVLALVAAAGNVFVAPASFFQNSYFNDVRGYSATEIALLTLCTATPAGLGLILGGRVADVRGRRRVIAVMLPVSTAFLVLAFTVAGPLLLLSVFLGGFLASVAYPALAVYRNELFPTGNRGRVAGYLTAAALLGGIGGLRVTGMLLDRDWSYGAVMGLMAIGQVVVVVVVLTCYPETAHRELEDLNPEDPPAVHHHV